MRHMQNVIDDAEHIRFSCPRSSSGLKMLLGIYFKILKFLKFKVKKLVIKPIKKYKNSAVIRVYETLL